ncbi:prephenate dehydrogenase [Nocardioides sp.]|uniref:prephenate dehydrogenase n=1 Tax=Nocardioides sp. TaxID=35761 RepID=UPI0039E3B868
MTEDQAAVEIVGAGLLGASVGLALRRAGVEVLLTDIDADHVRTASGMGAGRPAGPGDRVGLVVVAVPPAHLGEVIREALDRTSGTDAVVTDVGSVKAAPLAAVADHPRVGRYVGSHPMAGSERSGPLAASATLFDGRPWAVTPHPAADPDALEAVDRLGEAVGGVLVHLDPEEHDRAVARISHVPHLMAALMAGRLAEAPGRHLALSGQGVRDVTRVAAGDPRLYSQIVAGNASAVADLLHEVRAELDGLIAAVSDGDADGLRAILARGVAGTRAIPGKHGGPTRPSVSIFVAVPDEPGNLARLFADAGEIGVNIEDVHIDHDPGRPVGLLELTVEAARAEELQSALESRGWVAHR